MNGLKVFVVGVGPGSPEYLTPKARQIIQKCGIIVGWLQALERLSIDHSQIVLKQTCTNYRKIMFETAEKAISRKMNVAVVVIDDPLTYSAGIDSFREPFSGFELEFIPAVSSFQLAAAAARVSLEDSSLIVYKPAESGSLDQKDLQRQRNQMLKMHMSGYNLIVLSDLDQTLSQTAVFLLENGIQEGNGAIVSEQIGTGDERVTVTTVSDVAKGHWHWMSCMVIKHS